MVDLDTPETTCDLIAG